MTGKRRERRRGGVRGERRREPGRGRRGEVVVTRRGAGERLKGGVRREEQSGRLLFALWRACGVHRGYVRRRFLVEVWVPALCVMFESFYQARPLRRCYLVHVAAQLGHALLKAGALNAQERRSTGV